MTLIKCPECDREISNQAAACPQCGCPLPAPVALKPSSSIPSQIPVAEAVETGGPKFRRPWFQYTCVVFFLLIAMTGIDYLLKATGALDPKSELFNGIVGVLMLVMLALAGYSVFDKYAIHRGLPVVKRSPGAYAIMGGLLLATFIFYWVGAYITASRVAAANRKANTDAESQRPADPAAAALADGHRYFVDGKVEEAISSFSEAIRLDPKVAMAYASRGAAWNEKGDYDRAIKDFEEAISRDPKLSMAYVGRGRSWGEKGDYDRSIKDYDEATRIDPTFAAAYSSRGFGWAMKGDYGRAIKDCDDAIRLDPKLALAFFYRGLAHHLKGEYGPAIEDFDQAIKLRPIQLAWVYASRGSAWLSSGDPDRAIKDYDEAIRLDPKYATAYASRAAAWVNKGQYNLAIKDCDEAIRLNPTAAGAFSNRGWACYNKGDYERAIKDFDEAIRLSPTLASAYANAALLWATCPIDKLRDGKRATEYAKKACELTLSQDPGCLSSLAAAHAETGEWDSAVNYQQKAIALSPDGQKGELQSRLELYKSHKPYRVEAKKL